MEILSILILIMIGISIYSMVMRMKDLKEERQLRKMMIEYYKKELEKQYQ